MILKMSVIPSLTSMTATKKKINGVFYVGSVIAAAAIILIAASVMGSALITPHQVIASIEDTIEEGEGERVAVGGILDGNLTVSVNQFSPAAVEIQTGESVTFYAPENSTEVHNVVIDMSNGTIISGNELPFILPQEVDPEQQLELAPPFNFGEFIIQEQQPDGRQAIITLNKAAYYPTVADQANNTRYLIDVEEHEQLVEEARQQGFFEPQNLSANYTMNGTETIVTSGIILDVGGFDALFAEEEGLFEEEGEVSAENTTAAPTTPIPPAEIGEENAICSILNSMAHEIIHYQQWLIDPNFDEEKAEVEAENESTKLVDDYYGISFINEIIVHQKIWTIENEKGVPTTICDGEESMPFWSSELRTEDFIKSVDFYREFHILEISLIDFVNRWLPNLEKDELIVGTNLKGKYLIGIDWNPQELLEQIRNEMNVY
jgi:plastocyanin